MTYKIVKAPYRVKAPYGYEIDMTHFEELCAEIMEDGYRPTGGVQFLHSGYELREDLALQAFYKVNIPDFVGMADAVVGHKETGDAVLYESYEESVKRIEKAAKEKSYKDISIEDIGSTVRTINCFHNENIMNVEDIFDYKKDLRKIPGFGKKCYMEVKESLGKLGITLENY